MLFKPFGSTNPQLSASSGRIKKKKMEECKNKNIKEESTIHNLQVEAGEKKVLEERNEMK
jgi:hypothetical protein